VAATASSGATAESAHAAASTGLMFEAIQRGKPDQMAVASTLSRVDTLSPTEVLAMPNVIGIGGFFFRAKDPDTLAAWYKTHLGVSDFWRQATGATVFAPFKQDTDYFPADKQWMINFRVDDLDQVAAELRAAGFQVETRPDEWDSVETGRFARIHDPEGNAIELWEPPAAMRG
jgi:predicted enzyme related to lactoylglutathione lyase